MGSAFKNILIGVFVISALSIVVFMLLFLHPSVGDNAKTLHVNFTNIDKVVIGTRVTFAGHPVGEVVSIRELPDARDSRHMYNSQIYVYELTLKVDSSVNVFNTDTVSLRTSGLLGERNIDISPGVLKPDEQLVLVNDQILYAIPISSVEDTLKEFGELNNHIQVVLSDAHKILQNIQDEKIVYNLSQVVQHAVHISAAFDRPEKVDRFVDNLVRASDDLSSLTSRANKSWTNVDQAIDNVVTMTSNVKKISQNTLEGKGTIGRLFMKEDAYLRFKSILSKGDTLLNDIKQYGLLFQTNKKWQRLNARRQQLLQRLSNPDLFAAYFQDEMDQISTSLSSVSMLLNESGHYPDALINNPDFTYRFADLMKRVGQMEDSLNMYNEQVVDLGNPKEPR